MTDRSNRTFKAALAALVLAVATWGPVDAVADCEDPDTPVVTFTVGDTSFDTRVAAAWVTEEGGGPAVSITLCADGARALGTLTARGAGMPLTLSLDDRILAEPMIREPITGGTLVVSGAMTADEAAAVVEALGGLPE